VAVRASRGQERRVYVRNSPDGKIWHQAQVGSGSGSYLFGQTLVGGSPQGFNLSKELLEQRVRPAGEWNTYEITCRGKSISVWANGAVVCEWTGCEVPRGFIGVEGEGWKIEFRNLKLKEL
jgi:hypothetical protein